MKNLTRMQVFFILGAVLITVLLCFASHSPEKNSNLTLTSGHAGKPGKPDHSSVKDYLDSSMASLPEKEKDRVNQQVAALTTGSATPDAFGHLVALLDSLQKPAAAAYYMQIKARKSNTVEDWTKTAERYYVGSKYFASGHVLVDSAISAYNKVLLMDPGNLNAKTGLGVCYVEGTSNPMQGITLLQEVIKADSNYVDALLNLGNFAMTSGQFDKAITRFQKVLKLKPDYILLNVRIAEAYEKMGDKQKTIEYLEKYVKMENDVMLRTSIQNEINKLKNS
jgi:tetratricopeptide (TPR) repeat protein